MTRPKPSIDVPTIAPKQGDVVKQVRKYRLITPLFGGGVSAGYPDEVRPIRGSSLRGQLRFWWRATRGGSFDGDLQKMKEAEQALWGAAATTTSGGPSKVNLEVIVAEGKFGEPVTAFNKNNEYRPTPVAPAYAAFPLQPEQEEKERNVDVTPLLKDIEFSLSLTWPKEPEEHSREIEAALWAWETFGGIGARTRRGFGALELLSVNSQKPDTSTTEDIQAYVASKLNEHVVEGSWPEGVPHLTRSPQYRIVKDTWSGLIGSLKSFRQWRGNNGFGRSHWPEPDALRRLTKQYGHAANLDIDKFPRAALGLPIIFHFQQGDGEPHDTMLHGKTSVQGKETTYRLSSPLLLRPLPFTEGQQSIAIALSTEGACKPLKNLKVEVIKKQDVEKRIRRGYPTEWPAEATVTEKEAEGIDPLGGETDVITAFFNYLQ